MSNPTPSFFEQLDSLASSLQDAVEPVFESVMEMANEIGAAFEEAFTPLLARKNYRATGAELADLVAEERLTRAERYPVRASSAYTDDTVRVEYDGEQGWEEFATYSKEAIRDE